jgi:hypothetical protein
MKHTAFLHNWQAKGSIAMSELIEILYEDESDYTHTEASGGECDEDGCACQVEAGLLTPDEAAMIVFIASLEA